MPRLSILPWCQVPSLPPSSINRNGKECRGLIPNPPRPNSCWFPHHLRPPRRLFSSLGSVLEGRAADLYCLGSTCQVAGRCPNVRWVPGFTKRAGSTPLVWEPPRAPDHITREEER